MRTPPPFELGPDTASDSGYEPARMAASGRWRVRSLALLSLLSIDEHRASAATPASSNPNPGLAESSWRRPARAKSVIFLFMEGGPSHIDMFDPKPRLNELAGQPLPSSFKPVITPMGESGSPLLGSKR